jgi:hypothetical protein
MHLWHAHMLLRWRRWCRQCRSASSTSSAKRRFLKLVHADLHLKHSQSSTEPFDALAATVRMAVAPSNTSFLLCCGTVAGNVVRAHLRAVYGP